MMAAADEKAQGSPIAPTNQHERIVSQWIAPVRSVLSSAALQTC